MPKKYPLSAVVLAGGKSSRMGKDKSLLPFGGSSMIEYLASVLRPVFSETLIVADRKEKFQGLDLGGAAVHENRFPERGPLGGIYTGLAAARHGAACVLTCDMPFVDGEFLAGLAGFWEEQYDALCLEGPEGKLEPFPGIYHRQSRHLARLLLEGGHLSVRLFLRVAAVKILTVERKQIRVFTNLNTIEDYYQALEEKKESVS
jgi:molybdopterin-guanine dinucleotide biosynthesis protein A